MITFTALINHAGQTALDDFLAIKRDQASKSGSIANVPHAKSHSKLKDTSRKQKKPGSISTLTGSSSDGELRARGFYSEEYNASKSTNNPSPQHMLDKNTKGWFIEFLYLFLFYMLLLLLLSGLYGHLQGIRATRSVIKKMDESVDDNDGCDGDDSSGYVASDTEPEEAEQTPGDDELEEAANAATTKIHCDTDEDV